MLSVWTVMSSPLDGESEVRLLFGLMVAATSAKTGWPAKLDRDASGWPPSLSLGKGRALLNGLGSSDELAPSCDDENRDKM